MLLNRDTAEGIANGTITLVLRRWNAPRAKPGGTQRTVAGTVRIDDVAEHPGGYHVTAAQARAAGYPDPTSDRNWPPTTGSRLLMSTRSPPGWTAGTRPLHRGRVGIWR